jgi:DHA2 family multidrug resistance protein
VIVAPTVGPTLGGWIADNYSWHWIFFIIGPIGSISLLLMQWLVKEPEVLEQERRDRWKKDRTRPGRLRLCLFLFLGCLAGC